MESSDDWLSPANVWQYRTADFYCSPYQFGGCASLSAAATPIVSFAYDASGKIVTIDSAFRGARRLTFSEGPLEWLSPAYDGYTDLVLTEDALVDIPGSETVIEYDRPNTSVSGCDRCDFTGEQPYYASKITTPEGVWLYDFWTEISPWLVDPSETTRTDPDGNVSQIAVAKGFGTVYWTKDANNVEISSNWDTHFRVRETESTKYGVPIAPKIFLERDFRGNITEQKIIPVGGTLADAIVTTQQFPTDCTHYKTCNRPTRVVDPRGAATDFTYDNAHGGLLSAMGPPAEAGGARPLVLATWGQRYAWELSWDGSLVQSNDPVWVKLSETRCQTTAGADPSPVCDSNEPVSVTSYEYGADGTRESLFVKGVAVTADGETFRSCFTYDAMGRKLSETKPRANLASCIAGGV